MFGHKIKRAWSLVELQYLMENCDLLSIDQLSLDLDRSPELIQKQIEQFKLPQHRKSKKGPPAQPRVIRVCQNPMCCQAFVVTEYEIVRERGLYCSNQCSSFMRKIPVPSQQVLETDYASGLSANDIAAKYHISQATVFNLLKKHKIVRRSLSESLTEFFKHEKGKSAIRKRLDTLVRKYGTTCVGGGKGKFTHVKRGFRKDLGLSVRSGWEANVLRWLNFLKKSWQYEPRVFFFEGIKSGTMGYTPDIYVSTDDLWIEIKGAISGKDKTKTRRLKKYYPEEYQKLRVIVGKPGTAADIFYQEQGVPILAYYSDLKKQFAQIVPLWE